MIEKIGNLPSNMVGFKAIGEVTKEDFELVVLPSAKDAVNKTGELNYLFVVDTPLENFTIGAWMRDAWLGIKHLFKWNRGAIVSDSENIQKFTNVFSLFVPGEFKGFPSNELNNAINWVAGK